MNGGFRRSKPSVTAVPLKIIGCLLIVSAAFSAGTLLSKRLYRRRDFLSSFKTFLQALKTELRYNGGDIFSLVGACARQTGFPIDVDGDKPFEVSWQEAVGGIPRYYSLCAKDLELLTECGSQLGKTDLEGQLSHLSLIEARFDSLIAEAGESIAKKSRLYKTMGFFVGASAAILLL